MKTRLRWMLPWVAAVALALSGCGDSDSMTGPRELVTVSSGTTPTYTWTGGAAFSVSIARTSSPITPVWATLTIGANNLLSPVTHGTEPVGAITTATAESVLTAGRQYRVTVTRLDGVEVGRVDFTP